MTVQEITTSKDTPETTEGLTRTSDGKLTTLEVHKLQSRFSMSHSWAISDEILMRLDTIEAIADLVGENNGELRENTLSASMYQIMHDVKIIKDLLEHMKEPKAEDAKNG